MGMERVGGKPSIKLEILRGRGYLSQRAPGVPGRGIIMVSSYEEGSRPDIEDLRTKGVELSRLKKAPFVFVDSDHRGRVRQARERRTTQVNSERQADLRDVIIELNSSSFSE